MKLAYYVCVCVCACECMYVHVRVCMCGGREWAVIGVVACCCCGGKPYLMCHDHVAACRYVPKVVRSKMDHKGRAYEIAELRMVRCKWS